jgi:hypothetical protein
MFRKILFTAVASLGLLSPLALPAASDAHPVRPQASCYHVYFRECAREPWRCSGEFHSRAAANHAARRLHMRGFETYVR